ncbi:unnamed protein product [Mytilus edulis]|uniref:Uncharacterized protein n=1 Tax=Mytilus edulis TaxID=6550 RepID=A0A8S3RU08_MYTED|nr:unnamed protein product [Mytilus edulis]
MVKSITEVTLTAAMHTECSKTDTGTNRKDKITKENTNKSVAESNCDSESSSEQLPPDTHVNSEKDEKIAKAVTEHSNDSETNSEELQRKLKSEKEEKATKAEAESNYSSESRAEQDYGQKNVRLYLDVEVKNVQKVLLVLQESSYNFTNHTEGTKVWQVECSVPKHQSGLLQLKALTNKQEVQVNHCCKNSHGFVFEMVKAEVVLRNDSNILDNKTANMTMDACKCASKKDIPTEFIEPIITIVKLICRIIFKDIFSALLVIDLVYEFANNDILSKIIDDCQDNKALFPLYWPTDWFDWKALLLKMYRNNIKLLTTIVKKLDRKMLLELLLTLYENGIKKNNVVQDFENHLDCLSWMDMKCFGQRKDLRSILSTWKSIAKCHFQRTKKFISETESAILSSVSIDVKKKISTIAKVLHEVDDLSDVRDIYVAHVRQMIQEGYFGNDVSTFIIHICTKDLLKVEKRGAPKNACEKERFLVEILDKLTMLVIKFDFQVSVLKDIETNSSDVRLIQESLNSEILKLTDAIGTINHQPSIDQVHTSTPEWMIELNDSNFEIEAFRKRKQLWNIWWKCLNDRKQSYWNAFKCDKYVETYSHWISKESPILPRKYLIKEIKGEPEEETKLRWDLAISSFQTDISIIQSKQARYKQKYIALDSEMMEEIRRISTGNITEKRMKCGYAILLRKNKNPEKNGKLRKIPREIGCAIR